MASWYYEHVRIIGHIQHQIITVWPSCPRKILSRWRDESVNSQKGGLVELLVTYLHTVDENQRSVLCRPSRTENINDSTAHGLPPTRADTHILPTSHLPPTRADFSSKIRSSKWRLMPRWKQNFSERLIQCKLAMNVALLLHCTVPTPYLQKSKYQCNRFLRTSHES